MSTAIESDATLEQRARQQAEAIAAAQAIVLAEPAAMQAYLQQLGWRKAAPMPNLTIPPPGRELLLWRLKNRPDLSSALRLTFMLLQQSDFIASVPSQKDCPLCINMARRKWNDAVKQWVELGDPQAQTWLRCDRQLLLRRRGQQVTLHITRKDLEVQFESATQKLVPVRVELDITVTPENMSQLATCFPLLNVKQLSDALRAPERFLQQSGRKHAGNDAYVANAPLFATNMEAYLPDKKKAAPSEDPNKGFVTWLSNTLRSSSTK